MSQVRVSALLCAVSLAAFLPAAGAAAQPGPGAASATPPHSDAAAVKRAVDRIRVLLDRSSQVTGAYPAIAAIAVTRDTVPLMYVRGSTRATGGRPVDTDTPFYVASQTKSYVGLLAARLDETGVLPLNTSLAQIWPDLRLPVPADPTKITMRDLLTHQAPLETDTINFRTAWVSEVAAGDYPAMLAQFTQSRDPGFSYSNLGYLIYGAALEARTGKSWRDWIKAEVFRPLELNRTSARSSDFPQASLPWRHQWSGTAWHTYPPKPDTTMHPAGGIFSSSRDVARWMQANLTESFGRLRDSGAFRVSHARVALVEMADGDWACSGYGLGWMSCSYHGVNLLVHTGEYEGSRSVILVAPALGVGYSLMSNSDSMTGTLGIESAKLFVDLIIAHPDAEQRAATIEARFAEGPARLAASRHRELEESRADARWGGWTWRPTAAELRAYEGRFTHPGLGEMVVRLEGGVLVGIVGDLRQELQPAQPGLFGIVSTPFSPPEPVNYVFAADGQARELKWNDRVFTRR